MRVWVTRTRPGADRTAERLRALGHEPVVQPVLEVRPAPAKLDLEGVGLIAFTSANGVSAFAALTPRRDLPVFAVGDATAAAARAAGFTEVRSAAGDVAALAAALAAAPRAGAVLHAAGRPRAGDLAASGVPVRTVELYETVPLAIIPPAEIDAVLVHSPHAGRTLAAAGGRLPLVLAISEAAAATLRAISVQAIRIAARPDETALLALLPRDADALGANPASG